MLWNGKNVHTTRQNTARLEGEGRLADVVVRTWQWLVMGRMAADGDYKTHDSFRPAT